MINVNDTGMSTCMVLITILQYLWSEKAMQEARIASTVFLFIFSVFFAIGWQGMAWLYQVEIVPLRIRGPANGLSTSANWLLNFVYDIPQSQPSCYTMANTITGSFSSRQ